MSDDRQLPDVSELDAVDEPSEKMISRALGEELRRVREGLGWSRLHLVSLLPSGIGDRTLMSYEHGTRHLTVVRLIELCHGMAADSPTVLSKALQRARIYVERMPLQVDLRALLADRSPTFQPMVQWTRNTLNMHPDGVVELEPAVVRHLALFVGCTHRELAHYLARFIPDYSDDSEVATRPK